MVPLSFAGRRFLALPDAALFWPDQGALIVADLHFEKASFFARSGQLLPPFDSRETASRLLAAIKRTGARALWCLGDNYHDADGERRLDPDARAMVGEIARRVDLLWIAGNHDPVLAAPWGGRIVPEHDVDGIWLRHAATRDDSLALCGHYHPKLRLGGRGGGVARRCFVRSERRLILPAFGALTGGLDVRHPELARAAEGPAEALVPLADRLLSFPLGAAMRPGRAAALPWRERRRA